MKKNILFILLFAVFTSAFAQSGMKIKGRVIEKETQEALPGVTITLLSSSANTITDASGNFEISVPDPQSKLVIRYIGFQPLTVTAKNNMVVALEANTQDLSEVVVVGYGSMRKGDLTGSISTIKSKDLNVISNANVQSAMAGRAAGVQVVSSGAVDGAVKVRIRGIGTINNSDPLYVVDGFSTNDISYLAPTDIQSMEILKDASATAVYGSRGANGVILITTNKGADQPTKVNVNTYHGINTASKKLDVLDATTYAKARIEAYENGNMTMDPNDLAILNYAISNNKKGTDWQEEVLQTGRVQNYNANVVGGSEKVKFNLSGTYNTNEGVIKNSFVDKLIVRLNTEYQLHKSVQFGSNISFLDYTSSLSDLSNMYGATLMIAARSAPVSSIYDQFGNWQSNMSLDSNPVRKSEFGKYDNKAGNQYVGNFYLNVDVLKNLSFKSTFGTAYSKTKQTNYIPTFYVSPQEAMTTSELSERRHSGVNWVWSNVANYTFDLDQVHHFNTMLGIEATNEDFEEISATAFDVAENHDMRYISAAKSDHYQANSFQGSSSIFSSFLRVNYSYDNRYLLTTTLRSDVSSRFSKENRQGIFPSLSLGWNLKEESFLNGVSFLSQAKLRAGWGMVGNQSSTGIGDYLSTIANGKKYVLGGQVYEGRIPEYLSNPLLRWEVAKQSNIGLDMGFFNNQLNVTADYFIKDTKDMIVRSPIPDYVGALAPLSNVGSMRNKGFELTLNHTNRVNEFQYNIGFNLAFIKNEVTSLGRSGAIYTTLFDRLPSTSKTEIHHPMASYWGYQTDGVFHTQEELDAYSHPLEDGTSSPIQPTAEVGDVRYIDRDGNGIINADDQTYLGSYMPTFAGGFNIGFAYKNLSLSIFTDFTSGNKIANMNLYHLNSPLLGANILQSYYDQRWTPETPNNNQPRLTTSSQAGQNTLFSDRYIENGSFLRIRNAQLGYTIPKMWLQKLRIDMLRVYLSADNLFTFTNYSGFNPEVADQYGNPLAAGSDVGSTPLPRTISIGLNLNF